MREKPVNGFHPSALLPFSSDGSRRFSKIALQRSGTIDMITAETTIEELITRLPRAVTYLMEQGIRCMACGEPIWGTLGDAAREKGFHEEHIVRFVYDLNALDGTPYQNV